MKSKLLAVCAIALLSTITHQSRAGSQADTAFTYQGRLNDGGNAVGGIYDLRFAIYDSLSGGAQVGSGLTNSAVTISNGLFTVMLDFGGVFDGSSRWLEIGVRTNGSVSDFTKLTPRQGLTPTPYALYATSAGVANTASTALTASSVAAANVTGTLGLSQLPGAVVTNNAAGVTLAGTFIGSGAGLTNLDGAAIASGTVGGTQLGDGAVTVGKLATAMEFFSVTLNNPAPDASDRFASSVAAVGTDRVLIGTPYADRGAPYVGTAYLFSTNSTLLTTFTNPTPAVADYFGWSVAAVGTDRVLIGAYGDNTGATDAGAAYLFGTDGTLLTTFTNPTPALGDYFGSSVAAVGTDRVLIGAIQDDTGAADAGTAYLFSTNGTLLTTFTNPTPAAGDRFGFSVAAVGTDRVLIGAYLDDTGAADAGAAYLFSTNGTLIASVLNPAPAMGDSFGWCVAAVGTNWLLIGAPLADAWSANVGTAYLFRLDDPVRYVPGVAAERVTRRAITTDSLADGAVTSAKIGGALSASQIPDLDAAKITSGTLADARLSANVAWLNANQTFTGTNVFIQSIGLGTALANTKLALWSSGAASYGLGVQGGQFLLHLNTASDRFSFLDNAGGSNEVVTIKGTGNVGLGTANPQKRLEVVVRSTGDGLRVEGNGYAPAVQLTTNGTAVGELGAAVAAGQYSTDAVGGDFVVRSSSTGNKLLLQNGGAGAAITLSNNFVGIRKVNPTTALDVNGTVTATAFAGNAAGLTNLDATDLTGTVADARLSTNVALLNTNQAFTGSNRFAGVVTATNVANTFAGTFTGNGAGLTSLNASQLAAGTVPLAQLPGTVVTNNATAVILAGTFTGNGASLTNVNADQLDGQHGAFYQNATNLNAGTLADARLSTNVALLNTNQVFTGSNRFAGVVTLTNAANTLAGTFTGNGSGLTNLSASQLTTGTVPLGQLPAVVVTNNATGVALAGSFTGNGGGLTNLTGAAINTGTISSNQLAANSVDASKVVDGAIAAAELASDPASLAKVSGGAMAVTSGKIGIGVAAPAYPLTFANVLGDKISLWGNSGSHYGLGIQSGQLQVHSDSSASDVVFGYGESTNLTETMRVKGNGNVGIGTATPAAKLDVAGMASANSINVRGAGLLSAPLDVVTRGWTLDQQQTAASAYTSFAGGMWQSFTAGATGTLAGIALNYGARDGVSDWMATLSIYDGEGTGGTRLSTQTVAGDGAVRARMFSLDSPVALTAGSKYTIYMDPNISCNWARVNYDAYTNGISDYSATFDHWFQTYLDDGTIKTAIEVQPNTGNVGLGVTAPGYPLTFASVLGDKISLWGNSGAHYGFGIQGNLLQIHSSASSADIAFGYGESTNLTETVRFKGNGNVGIGTNNPTQKLVVAGNIYATGTITPNSDRSLKTDFAPVDAAAVLDKVAALPIQQWRFQAEDTAVKHVGPMAQDFRAAFGLGAISTAIATVDADGVALAAIQGLNQKLEAKNATLEKEVADLKAMVKVLAEKVNGATR